MVTSAPEIPAGVLAAGVEGAVIAVDTSIGTSVAALATDGTVLFERREADTRRHAELIGPLLGEAFAATRAASARLLAVVVGMGPGPFTGLRVGIAAARAFAFGAGVPVLSVVSHDALAASVQIDDPLPEGSEFLVHSDARRRERYWSRYRVTAGGKLRREGESVVAAESPVSTLAQCTVDTVSAVYLARCGLAAWAAGEAGPGQALYLRSPDVTLAPAKGVTG